MNEETMVAVFDRPDQADAAVRDLLAAGLSESAITRHARTASGMTPAAETVEHAPPREEGFWSRLFGGDREYDSQVYERSVEGGSTVISVQVPEHQITRVAEILDRHNPVDIDERATGYGLTGTAATAPVADYAETPYDAPVARTAEIADPAERARSAAAYERAGADLAETGAVGIGESETLRLAEERLAVGKRLINRGGTRIRRYVVETPVEKNVTLHEERVTLDCVPVTDVIPANDADFTERTIEMTETSEEAVISKEAFVTEEIHLRREAVDRVETVRETVAS